MGIRRGGVSWGLSADAALSGKRYWSAWIKCLPNISLRLTQPFKFLFSKDFNDFLSSFILPFTVNSFYSGHCIGTTRTENYREIMHQNSFQCALIHKSLTKAKVNDCCWISIYYSLRT